MSKFAKRIMIVLAAAGLLVAASATPALAFGSAGCGVTCDGISPYTVLADSTAANGSTVCASDATDKRSAVATGSGGTVTVILRYSPNCRSAWAKYVEGSGANSAWSEFVWVESAYSASVSDFRVGYTNSGRCFRLAWAPQCPDNFAFLGYVGDNFTYMVNDAGMYARACIRLWKSEGATDPYDTYYDTCTSWY